LDQNPCEITLNINEKIEGPVYVYYELGNFYQNHRRYVKSRSYSQLMGNEITLDDAKADCDPIVTNEDAGRTKNIEDGPNGPQDLDPEAVAIPCGLIAKSFFTDSYTMAEADGTDVPIDSSDIAWKSDVEFKFKNQPGDYKKVQWTDI